MKEEQTKKKGSGIDLGFDLDDPPQKVWRAVSIPEFRKVWLPNQQLSELDAIIVTPGQEICYKMRDNDPPFIESTVTVTIVPNAMGGTHLRIVHEVKDMRFDLMARAAANNNTPLLMLAA